MEIYNKMYSLDDMDMGEGGNIENNEEPKETTEKNTNEETNELQIENQQELELDNVTLWCVSHKQFVREFKIQLCIKFARDKLDESSGKIVDAMYELIKGFNTKESEKQIDEKLIFQRFEEDDSIQPDALRKYLELLVKDKIIKVYKGRDTNLYTINQKWILQVVQDRMVDSIILDKFGKESLRIFKMLREKKYLELEKIPDMAIIDPTVAKDSVYKMWKNDIIHLQEIPKSTDHNPNRTFFLWTVRIKDVILNLKNECLKTQWNLFRRMRYELDRHRDLLTKYEEDERLKDIDSDFTPQMSTSDIQRFEYLFDLHQRLYNCIHQIDDTLLILSFNFDDSLT